MDPMCLCNGLKYLSDVQFYLCCALMYLCHVMYMLCYLLCLWCICCIFVKASGVRLWWFDYFLSSADLSLRSHLFYLHVCDGLIFFFMKVECFLWWYDVPLWWSKESFWSPDIFWDHLIYLCDHLYLRDGLVSYLVVAGMINSIKEWFKNAK